ncbi:MAG: hypothetical protein ACOYB2_13325 [Limnohabitans sp.]|jgi:hypothetical protein
MEHKITFLALSNILKAVEGGSTFGSIELESQIVLKFIAANEQAGHELCVTDITNNNSIPGAAATKLKRVHRLRDEGWLDFSTSAQHHRRLRIVLSQKAKDEMSQMSELLNLQLRSILS